MLVRWLEAARLLSLSFAALAPLAWADPPLCVDYALSMRTIAERPAPAAHAVACVDDVVYVAGSDFHAFSITDPRNPIERTVRELDRTGYTLAVSAGHAYVGTDVEGVVIFDVTVPTVPVRVGRIALPGWPGALRVIGDRLYVGSSDFLYAFDLTDPAAPVRLSSLATPSLVTDVALVDQYLYVLILQHGVAVVPASPFGAMPLEIALPLDQPQALALGPDQTVLVVDRVEGLVRLDVATPSAPVVLDQSAHQNTVAVVARGDVAFVARDRGILSFDLTTSPPTNLGLAGTPRSPLDLCVFDDYLCVADWSMSRSEGRLSVVDARVPGTPQNLYHYDLAGSPSDIFERDGLLYISQAHANGDNQSRLDIVDPSDPRSPLKVSELFHSINIGDTELVGEVLLCTSGHSHSGGIWGVDVTDPTKPVSLGNLLPIPMGGTIAMSGQLAFVTGDPVRVVDVSEPRNPQLENEIGGFGTVLHGAVDGDLLLMCNIVGVEVARIEGATLTPLGAAPTPGIPGAWSRYVVPIGGGLGYVSNGSLLIIDYRDPSAPVATPLPGVTSGLEGLVVHRGYLYLADARDGVDVLDIQDPWNPRKLGVWSLHAGSAFRIAGGSGYVAVMNWERPGLNLLPMQCSIRAHLEPIPLPPLGRRPAGSGAPSLEIEHTWATRETTFRLLLPFTSPVTATVYDVAGRRVRALMTRERLVAGEHLIRWDGRSDGQLVPSGVYFLSVETPSGRAAEKLVLVRAN